MCVLGGWVGGFTPYHHQLKKILSWGKRKAKYISLSSVKQLKA